MKDALQIVFSSDERYAPHLGVALASLIATSAPSTRAVIRVLDGGISPANRRRLHRVTRRGGNRFQLEFIRPDDGWVRDLPLRHYYRVPVYYRYWMHRSMPPEIGRVLYLDCDMVVRRDLTELYTADLGGRPVGAALDKYLHEAPRRVPGWPVHARDYFNTGMLVMDLAAWKASGCSESMRDLLEQNPGHFLVPDQDAFNLACRGQVRELSFAWNYQIVSSPDADLPLEPWIVHYLGDVKPWNFWNTHPLRHCYREMRRRTPWRFHPYEFGHARKGMIILGGRLLPEFVKRPLRALLGIPAPHLPGKV